MSCAGSCRLRKTKLLSGLSEMSGANQKTAYCVFCDDIRHEVGNKSSLIGVYSGEMILVGNAPLIIPKFCMDLTISSPRDEPMKSLSVLASMGEDPLIKAELSSDELEAGQKAAMVARNGIDDDDPLGRLSVRIQLVASPLNVSSEGVINVVAVVDGQEIQAGRLRIRINPSSTD